MSKDIKPTVDKAAFDALEIRVGRVLSAQPEPSAPKAAYRIEADFGKFGRKTSVGRFTQHAAEDLVGRLIVGVLNLGTVTVGAVESEFLILGTQYPKADSGEATPLTPVAESKIGGKVF